MSARALAAALAALATLAGGCSRSDRGDQPAAKRSGPPPVSTAERQRGVRACRDYRERVCACADDDPALAADCRMAGSRIKALDLSLGIARSEPEGDDSSRAAALANARRVMQRCIEQAGELAMGCPVKKPAESAAPQADASP